MRTMTPSNASDIHHPIFARLYRRNRRVAARRGEDDHRRRLLEGLAGRVVEVGAGEGGNFGLYPSAVGEVIAVEPEPTLRGRRAGRRPGRGGAGACAFGRPITEVTVGPDDTDVAQRIMASIRRSGSWEGEFWVHRRDGTRFLAFVRDGQITDSQDRPVAIVGFSVELTTESPATPDSDASDTAHTSPAP